MITGNSGSLSLYIKTWGVESIACQPLYPGGRSGLQTLFFNIWKIVFICSGNLKVGGKELSVYIFALLSFIHLAIQTAFQTWKFQIESLIPGAPRARVSSSPSYAHCLNNHYHHLVWSLSLGHHICHHFHLVVIFVNGQARISVMGRGVASVGSEKNHKTLNADKILTHLL